MRSYARALTIKKGLNVSKVHLRISYTRDLTAFLVGTRRVGR